MNITGLIYRSFEQGFVLKTKNKLTYYYLQRNLLKKFGRFLFPGVFISITVDDEPKKYKEICCYTINSFNEISNRNFKKPIIYYSIDLFRNGIKEILNKIDNIVFLDFEFNMQEYYPIKNFSSEIIEVGYCLCDKDLNTIKQENIFLNPTKYKKITKRTMKFLNYSKDQLLQRKTYSEFYDEFTNIVNKYDPYFIVWGKNDIASIKQSFIINKVKNIKFKFIDLSQMHVNYYNLKNMPGLFKMAESYNDIELPKQTHNALEDALMTKLVFSKFKEAIK